MKSKKRLLCFVMSAFMAFSIAGVTTSFAATDDETVDEAAAVEELAVGDDAQETDDQGLIEEAPEAVAASVSDMAVETYPGRFAVILRWNKVDGADAYQIYRTKGEELGDPTGEATAYSQANKSVKKADDPTSENLVYTVEVSDEEYSLDNDTATDKCYVDAESGKLQFRDGGQDGEFNKFFGSADTQANKLPIHDFDAMYYYMYKVVPVKAQTTDGVTEYVPMEGSDSIEATKGWTIRPIYVRAKVKISKPYYNTSSNKDLKKKGYLKKGDYMVGIARGTGRWQFWNDSKKTKYWYGQKNMSLGTFYYTANGIQTSPFGKEQAAPYSDVTCLDYANHKADGKPVVSKTSHTVWLSKGTQHVYIFQKNEDGTWRMDDNYPVNITSSGATKTCTPSGDYVLGGTKGKNYRASVYRSKFWYWDKAMYNDVNSFHTVLYKSNSKKYKKTSTRKAGIMGDVLTSEDLKTYYSKIYHVSSNDSSFLGKPFSNGCCRLFDQVAAYIYGDTSFLKNCKDPQAAEAATETCEKFTKVISY